MSTRCANLRIVSCGPSIASGGMTAFTREPSGRRASTIGDDSSMRRPSGADDAVDDPQHVLLGEELGVGQLDELAAALDVDTVGAVDHHLGDGRVVEEALDRPVAERVVDDLAHELARARRR